jgi:prepilin-type N-terminal cleavage/methylation domain-containing protein
MVQRYTILKVLIQTSNKGFTLIELLVGLVITFIIGGLAMDAFINSSNSFRNDQRNIDNSQNLSAILEIVGNDIQQAGEQISEGSFPVIKIEPNTDTSTPLPMPGSSKITIRKALTSALTLCTDTLAATTVTSLVVVADTPAQTNANCKVGDLSTNVQKLTGSTPGAISPSIIRPKNTLMVARRYRCKLDDPTIDYTAYDTTPYTPDTIDFCLTSKPTPDLEKVRAAMSDTSGKIWTFDYTDDSYTATTNTATPPVTTTTASISIANMGTPPPSITYPVGTPIYLIEERIYTLDDKGNLNMAKDGGTSNTLIKGIRKFSVSAKVYSDTTTKAINPNYITDFNPATVGYNWKTLAGVKVDLQANYDSTGRSKFTDDQLDDLNATDPNILKLRARAEFFPRNVLSK